MRIRPLLPHLFLKALRHLAIVALFTLPFVILVHLGVWSAETLVPDSVEKIFSWFFDAERVKRTVILSALGMASVIYAERLFYGELKIRKHARILYFLLAGLIVGTSYTWSGLFFAYWAASKYVSFVPPLRGALAGAAGCFLLGFAVWDISSRVAVSFRRQSKLP